MHGDLRMDAKPDRLLFPGKVGDPNWPVLPFDPSRGGVGDDQADAAFAFGWLASSSALEDLPEG